VAFLAGVRAQKDKSLEKLAKTSASLVFDVPEYDYDSFLVYFARQFIPSIRGSELVLDLGCNYGNFLLNFDHIGAIGIDLRLEPLSAFNKYSKSKYTLIQASGTTLPFSSSLFDVVFIWDVIEHVPAQSELTLLREINRLLVNGGILLMSTPSDSMLSIITDPAFFVRRHRHYSLREIGELVELANFELLNSSLKGDLSSVFAINLLYFRKWVLKSKILSGLQKRLDERSEFAVRSRNGGNLEWYVVARKKNRVL
jgi:SAM-dependent methyltransferase